MASPMPDPLRGSLPSAADNQGEYGDDRGHHVQKGGDTAVQEGFMFYWQQIVMNPNCPYYEFTPLGLLAKL